MQSNPKPRPKDIEVNVSTTFPAERADPLFVLFLE